jgi:signal transduction histidine kinase
VSSLAAGPRWPRKLWPQRVRARLTLTYALLFLAGGSVLLGLTYGLVAATLPTHSSFPVKTVLSHADFVKLCKQKAESVAVKPRLNTKTGVLTPAPKASASKPVTTNSKLAKLCEQAALALSNAALSSQRERALNSLLLYSLVGLGLATIASGGVGWVVSGRVLKPVSAITQTARRASERHLGERIALSGPDDELKELADTFDDMLARLDQAFASQRRFVADASHELRTPLAVMRTAIDVTLAKPGRTAAQLEATAVRVRAAIDRAEHMIDALLTLAVSDQRDLAATEPFDLATAAEDAVDTAAADIARLGLRLDADLAPAETTGDPHLLERMIGNLVANAVRHNSPGGEITLASGTREGQAFFRVANSGPVVPNEVIPSLFEPFTRAERRTGNGSGAGLGLTIARSVAIAHGTTVQARSRPGGGLDVLVTMPGPSPKSDSPK